MQEDRTRRAVFLDRDGVLNRPTVRDGKPYPPTCAEELVLLPRVKEACARLRDAGYLLVVVTNQPDVGRGTLTKEIVEGMHARLRALLPLADVRVCYHAGGGHGQPCKCRKPQPGLVLAAAADLNIDLKESYLVGDRWRDVECGKRAGVRTVFLDWGYDEFLAQKPDFRAADLLHAVDSIIAPRLPV